MPPAQTVHLSTDDYPDDHQPRFRIRPARREDCTELHRLIRELASHLATSPHRVTITPEQLREDAFGPAHPPRFFALVIERLDPPPTGTTPLVGYSVYYEKYSTWKGRILWIEDIYIAPAYRQYGLGGALMRALASIAAQHTMDRIEWSVFRWNSDAIGFYQSIGAFDLTKAEDWLLYRFDGDRYRDFLARPFRRSETIKIL